MVGGGVVSGMPTLERQEVSAPSWEICLRLPLEFIQLIEGQHQRLESGAVFLLIRLAQRLHRLVDAAKPFVIFGVLQGFRRAGSQQDRQADDPDRHRFSKKHGTNPRSRHRGAV